MLFNAAALNALKPTADDVAAKRYREHFADGSAETAPGLAVRVAPTGGKTFTFHYTLAGKRARMDLGRFPAVTLADARNAVTEARRALEAGQDPRTVRAAADAAAKAAAAGALTVAQVVALYVDSLKMAPKPLKTIGQIETLLTSHIVKPIGAMVARDLHRRDVSTCINAIKGRGSHTMAHRAFRVASVAFDWAVAEGHLDANPMAGMVAPEMADKGEKVRPLADSAEIAAFWNGIESAYPAYCANAHSRILKLSLLTGCRVSEAAEIGPGEIVDGVWTIPGARTKNGKAHAIPLNAAMLALIGNDLDNPWGEVNGKPVTGQRVSEVFSDNAIWRKIGSTVKWTPHSLRRTTATGMDSLDVSESIISDCLNHSKRGDTADGGAKVTARYIMPGEETLKRRACKRLEQKRQAFDEWTRAVLEIVAAR